MPQVLDPTVTCKACDQDRYLSDPDTDLSAAQPPALNHACAKKGPRTKKELLRAVERAAKQMRTSFSSLMPGGDFYSREELDALLFRLAGGKL